MMTPAVAALLAVSIGYADYTPRDLQVVVGDTVTWTQDSVRRHTVTAEDGSFDSGSLVTGDEYRRTFAATGEVPYYCRLHAGITGSVTVREVILEAPEEPAAGGRPYPLAGRAAAGVGEVVVAGDDGSRVAADPGEDGSFVATVTPATTTTYRAGDSAPVTLVVRDRTVVARRTGPLDVEAEVVPASPGATVVLQVWRRERFGWWPVARRVVGRDSTALLRGRRGRARVVLTLADGATPLAVSPVLRLGPPARRGPSGRS